MEMEFKDNSRRRRFLLLIGVVLALVAGGAAFMLSSGGAGNAQAQVEMRTVLVAAREIPARTVLTASDLTLRDLPKDAVVTQAYDDPDRVIGLVTGVNVYLNQPITPNLLATSAADAAFAILAPDEQVSPETPYWRAVSVMVPAERAVGGELMTGQRVDLIATVKIDVLTLDPESGEYVTQPTEEGYYSGNSTKITFEDLLVLDADTDANLYVLKVDLNQAEEITHLQADGANTFSIALRPEADTRAVDRSQYGETTERIIEQYQFVVPKILDLLTLTEPTAETPPEAETPSNGSEGSTP
jgi:Flp pilus assembly protein CpaB